MIRYFRVDNTGWSGGISWFEGDTRFATFDEARNNQRERDWGDDSIKWRITEVTIQFVELDTSRIAQKTIQERYLYLS